MHVFDVGTATGAEFNPVGQCVSAGKCQQAADGAFVQVHGVSGCGIANLDEFVSLRAFMGAGQRGIGFQA